MDMPAARRIGPLRAFLANLVGLGLGYVYVGELGLGLATVAATFCVFFLFAWSRLIVSSAQWMWIDAAILLVISGIALIHPIVIAFRQRELISR